MNENDDNSYRCDDFIHMSTVPVIMKIHACTFLTLQKTLTVLYVTLHITF